MADAKPILVPLDGSKIAEHALPGAAWLSRMTGAPIQFIHVVELNVDDAALAAAAETFRAYTKEVAAEYGLANTTWLPGRGNPESRRERLDDFDRHAWPRRIQGHGSR